MLDDPKAWLISREAAENNLKRVEDEKDAFESLYEEAATHTIVALYKQLEAQAADLKKYKPDFDGCLNCGAKEPCDLDKPETANDPNWPGSPCMFEPTPKQIFDAFQAQRERTDALEAENKRYAEAGRQLSKVIAELSKVIADQNAATQAAEEMMRDKCANAACGYCADGTWPEAKGPNGEPAHQHGRYAVICKSAAIRAIPLSSERHADTDAGGEK